MTCWVYSGLRGIVSLHAVNTTLQAVDGCAGEQVLCMCDVELLGPFEVEIALQAARIIVQGFVVLDLTDVLELGEHLKERVQNTGDVLDDGSKVNGGLWSIACGIF